MEHMKLLMRSIFTIS